MVEAESHLLGLVGVDLLAFNSVLSDVLFGNVRKESVLAFCKLVVPILFAFG